MSLLSKYLKASIAIWLCLLFSCNLFSQNLIRNGSFENYNTPVNWNWWGGDFIGYYVNPPDTVMIDWKQYSSPDFYVSACTHTYSSVPVNIFGYAPAKEGNAYAGFISYIKGGYIKEYIYQRLSQPLEAGKIYCLSFYVVKSDRIPYAIHSIGALFSASTPAVSNGHEINATPQVVNQTGFITDTVNWTQIQGCFTANGGEQYMIIGNFTPNANTDTLNVGTNNQVINGETESYYYIDDIELWDVLTTSIEDVQGNKFNVYPNPANGILNFSEVDDKDLSIKITDIIGREILIMDYKTQVDVSIFEKGIYFISILKNNRTLVIQKIVKE